MAGTAVERILLLDCTMIDVHTYCLCVLWYMAEFMCISTSKRSIRLIYFTLR